MPAEITMPQLSDTMTEGTVVKWHKKEGDAIKAGEEIADVETDKATMPMEAFDSGVLALIKVKEGEKVAVGGVLAVIAIGSEKAEEVRKKYASGGAKSAPAPSTAPAAAPAPTGPKAPPAPTAPKRHPRPQRPKRRLPRCPLKLAVRQLRRLRLRIPQPQPPPQKREPTPTTSSSSAAAPPVTRPPSAPASSRRKSSASRKKTSAAPASTGAASPPRPCSKTARSSARCEPKLPAAASPSTTSRSISPRSSAAAATSR